MFEARAIPSAGARTQRAAIARSDVLVAVLLASVMLVGGYFRFVGQNWDDFVHFHPDERFLTGLASRVHSGLLLFTNPGATEQEIALRNQEQLERCLARNPGTNGLGGYFDTECSPWNPHNVGEGFYAYGTLPLFVARISAELQAELTNDPIHVSYEGVHLVWRSVSAVSDMLVILLVFAIGTQLHNRWTGLLAAALYAFCVFPIQQSHFGTADPIANFCVALAITFAVRAQDSGSVWDYAAFGLGCGLALASRINLAPIVGLGVAAAAVQIVPVFSSRIAWEERNRVVNANLVGLLIAAIITIITFRVLNPYAFNGPGILGIGINDRWWQNLEAAQYGVSGLSDIPPNYQWLGRVDYLYPWSNMVLWGMGAALGLTGWLAWGWSGWRAITGKPGGTRNLLLFGWILVYFGWLGANWVASMRYFLPLYPALCVLAAWALIELWRRADQPGIRRWRRIAAGGLLAGVLGLTLLWAAMFTNIYRHMATFVQASHWVWENVPGDFAMRIEGAGEDVPLLNIAMPHQLQRQDRTPLESYLFESATVYDDGREYAVTFSATAAGTVTEIIAPHLGAVADDDEPETIRIEISRIEGEENPEQIILATASLTRDLPRDQHQVGEGYVIPLDEPFGVEPGIDYTFTVTVSGGPIVSGGSVIAADGGWEEVMPAKVCTLPAGITLADDPPPGLRSARDCDGRAPWEGLIQHWQFNNEWADVEAKRVQMLRMLDESDYILIPTNRRYDSAARNPTRFPLTNFFYDRLFAEELGYEIVAVFDETFELGPLRVSDQRLPTYDSPAWLEEFEAEEAFHVYDHPAVFIFQKRDDYDPDAVRALLESVSLNSVALAGGYVNPLLVNVYERPTIEADPSPNQLLMTDEMRETQVQGGTWSERFDSDSLINTQPVVTVAMWWLAIVALGWVAWPILFALLPGLADRGYGLAKFMGMFLCGWGTWVLATLRIPVWSQAGLGAAMLVLMALSGWIVVRQWEKFSDYLRRRWRLLLWMEIISTVAFVFFLSVRLMNPDLWHGAYGGEKPMDFAYFNGVLRSTIFPPIDPWYSGGYINYYYFGFVIVGVPTLLLGVVPSIAYNLIIPTLFSLTGIAAFSIAFNIVSAWRGNTAATDRSAGTSARRTLGNPWVAGIAAFMMCVVLGNLDTVRLIAQHTAQLGGYRVPEGLNVYLTREYLSDNALLISDLDQATIDSFIIRANERRIGDVIEYEAHKITSLVSGFFSGLFRIIFDGQPLYISPDRWFWGPTRVISEIPTVADGSINEMPYFTFLYGDLHAHMIAMPLILFVIAFLYNELIVSGRDRRVGWAQIAALALGAIAVGMSRATNTWDWPTLTILSVMGLGYAWWLKWGTISRWSLIDMVTRIGGFLILMTLAVLPYDYWFATGYGSIGAWNGPNTPLWAYLDIHGLFLFFIVSVLIWETARWLRAAHVRNLRGRATLLLAGLLIVMLAWLAAAVMFLRGERAGLVVLPIIAWAGLLFFRPGQSRSMQFILVLIGLSLAITLGVEFVVLLNDNGRQNTVFKFYMQVWLMLSVVGGVSLSWLVAHSDRWHPRLRSIWYGMAAILLFIAALYPLMATRGKAVFRMANNIPFTLDGMEYMRYAQHLERNWTEIVSFAPDYEVIRWLQENVEGTPTLIEAQFDQRLYGWGSGRISVYTGLPSVVGWDHHQTQQRSLPGMDLFVRQRAANVDAFYLTESISEAARILRHYDVTYMIVSDYEYVRYSEGGLAKLNEMVELGLLTPVFTTPIAGRGEDAVIYQVNQDALPDAIVEQEVTFIVEPEGQ